MGRVEARRLLLLAGLLGLVSLGPAPATPSYLGVERTVARVLDAWEQPGARPQPNAPGWRAFFDALKADLTAYGAARSEDDRLRALGRVHRKVQALGGVGWAPALELRNEVRGWLRPRVSVAWAERRLVEAVRRLPAPSGAIRANHEQWVRFVDGDLSRALAAYEGAPSAGQKVAGLRGLHDALMALQRSNQARPWGPSQALQGALAAAYNLQNLDATADVNALAPSLSNPVVTSGPIYFKGNLSFVTAGPRTGYGLLSSDDGIAFFNSQYSHSVTPISGFHDQVAQDRKGRRAAKMYHFDATSTDTSHVSIVSVLRPTGLQLFQPEIAHNIGAAVSSTPVAGKGLGRFIAGLIGFSQPRITQQVWEGAIGKIQQGVVEGAAELGAIKAGQAEAEKNAQLANYLVGNNLLRFKDFGIAGLNLRSRPSHALIGGTVVYLGGGPDFGADLPKPPTLAGTFTPGISADVHLPSILQNVVGGLLASAPVRGVENIMIVTREVPPGTPPQQAVEVRRNVDFATYLQEVEKAAAANNPAIQAIRIVKPDDAPDFAADANGDLVVVARDFVIEVPAPPQAARGGLMGPAAKIYRIQSEAAEFTIAFEVVPPRADQEMRLTGKVVGVDFGPNTKVTALNEDEATGAPVTAFAATLITRVLGSRLAGRPIDFPLGSPPMRGYVLSWVTKMDASGWLRANLMPTGAPAPLAPKLAPPPVTSASARPTPRATGPAAAVATAAGR